MERINIYNVRQSFSKRFIAIGVFFVIIGLTLLSRALYIGFNIHIFDGNWNAILIIGQGIIFIIMGFQQLKYRDYFIEWNENKIRYFLKGDKQIRSFEIRKIKSIEIKLSKIIILTYESQNGVETEKEIEMNFEQVEYVILKRIKDKFAKLKSILSS